jgi:predicted nucleic-acid-binding protein
MIGLDSNILVRYFTQDDPGLSPKANDLIERQLGADKPGFISSVAMAETIWVLRSAYAFDDAQIVAAIEIVIENDVFEVEHRQDVFLALVAFDEGGDFADALIGSIGLRAGCTRTLTFDRKAARLPGFALLS